MTFEAKTQDMETLSDRLSKSNLVKFHSASIARELSLKNNIAYNTIILIINMKIQDSISLGRLKITPKDFNLENVFGFKTPLEKLLEVFKISINFDESTFEMGESYDQELKDATIRLIDETFISGNKEKDNIIYAMKKYIDDGFGDILKSIFPDIIKYYVDNGYRLSGRGNDISISW